MGIIGATVLRDIARASNLKSVSPTDATRGLVDFVDYDFEAPRCFFPDAEDFEYYAAPKTKRANDDDSGPEMNAHIAAAPKATGHAYT